MLRSYYSGSGKIKYQITASEIGLRYPGIVDIRKAITFTAATTAKNTKAAITTRIMKPATISDMSIPQLAAAAEVFLLAQVREEGVQ